MIHRTFVCHPPILNSWIQKQLTLKLFWFMMFSSSEWSLKCLLKPVYNIIRINLLIVLWHFDDGIIFIYVNQLCLFLVRYFQRKRDFSISYWGQFSSVMWLLERLNVWVMSCITECDWKLISLESNLNCLKIIWETSFKIINI